MPMATGAVVCVVLLAYGCRPVGKGYTVEIPATDTVELREMAHRAFLREMIRAYPRRLERREHQLISPPRTGAIYDSSRHHCGEDLHTTPIRARTFFVRTFADGHMFM